MFRKIQISKNDQIMCHNGIPGRHVGFLASKKLFFNNKTHFSEKNISKLKRSRRDLSKNGFTCIKRWKKGPKLYLKKILHETLRKKNGIDFFSRLRQKSFEFIKTVKVLGKIPKKL